MLRVVVDRDEAFASTVEGALLAARTLVAEARMLAHEQRRAFRSGASFFEVRDMLEDGVLLGALDGAGLFSLLWSSTVGGGVL